MQNNENSTYSLNDASSNHKQIRQQMIMQVIFKNSIEDAKLLAFEKQNLNFTYYFTDLDIDEKISPLILASYLGRIELVKLCLQNQGIDIDMGSEPNDITPLIAGCITNNYETVKLLIEAGAEVNKPSFTKQTPLTASFTKFYSDVNIYENKMICIKMAELLLDNGADINWMVDKKNGWTFLMQLAVSSQKLTSNDSVLIQQQFRFLIQHGADIDINDNKQRKVLDLIIQKSEIKQELQQILNQTKQIYFHNNTPIKQGYQIQQLIAQKANKVQKKKSKNFMSYLALCNKK